MADNNDLLSQINKRFDTLEQGQKRLEQGQAQTNTTVAQIKTALEAVDAGQKDQATKADIHRLEQKIDKVDKHVKSHESRIENLEEHTETPNPHKN